MSTYDVHTNDQPMAQQQQVKSNTAKKRWKLLANSLRKGSVRYLDCSIRRFEGFELFEYEKDHEDDLGIWFTVQSSLSDATVVLRILRATIDAEKLIGFNNTGNICIWPSEEVLAYHCLKNKGDFKGKRVCEIGGGMTCLAGLLVGVATDIDEVLLTDGNIESVENITSIIAENKRDFKNKNVSVRHLIWDKNEDLKCLANRYDHIICADCLFFTEAHDDLIFVIHTLLATQGVATLFAPRRGGTLELFLKKASEHFDIDVKEEYDDWILKKHVEESMKPSNQAYDKDIHYPLLIKMWLKTN